MKTILLLIISGLGFWFCNTKAEQYKKEGKKIAMLSKDSINFKTAVEPILQKNCSPCHFPGGKQYAKLPFDKGETIINHEAVVLKRLKNENEIALIKQFIQQYKEAK